MQRENLTDLRVSETSPLQKCSIHNLTICEKTLSYFKTGHGSVTKGVELVLNNSKCALRLFLIVFDRFCIVWSSNKGIPGHHSMLLCHCHQNCRSVKFGLWGTKETFRAITLKWNTSNQPETVVCVQYHALAQFVALFDALRHLIGHFLIFLPYNFILKVRVVIN